jgi:hypothetical protein
MGPTGLELTGERSNRLGMTLRTFSLHRGRVVENMLTPLWRVLKVGGGLRRSEAVGMLATAGKSPGTVQQEWLRRTEPSVTRETVVRSFSAPHGSAVKVERSASRQPPGTPSALP